MACRVATELGVGLRGAGFATLLLAASLAAPAIAGEPGAVASDAAKGSADAAAATEFFEREVRPVLSTRCQSCHGAQKQKGGLRLDSAEALQRGGDSGPVVTSDNLDGSPLIQAVRYAEDPKMPPDGKLPEPAVAAIAQWVRMGAPWPASSKADPAKGNDKAGASSWREHWAFRPVANPAPPEATSASGWASSPIDRFILDALRKNGLTPSVPADRRTLIRRVTFDLLGLPPSPEEIEAFVADPDPAAYGHLVDRLLDSPQYGERWGRHWLDVARYADTKGYTFQESRKYPYAYTYRDWVVRAMNDDMPYDRFLSQQLAADCLGPENDKHNLAALGFLTVGRRFLNNQPDIIDDRIDVIARGTMGLTVACARCHDHKFDPIPTADYYSLYGVLASTDEQLAQIEKPSEEFARELAKREREINEYLQREHQRFLKLAREHLGDYLRAVGERKRRGRVESFMLGDKDADLEQQVLDRWSGFLGAIERQKFNPVFSPWFAFLELPNERFADAAALLVAHYDQQRAGDRRVNRRIVDALLADPPKTLAEAAAVYGRVLIAADDEWRQALATAAERRQSPPKQLADADQEEVRRHIHGHRLPFDVPVDDFRHMLNTAQHNKLVALETKIVDLRASPTAPAMAMAMADKQSPVKQRVFLRGNPGAQGPETPRQFLACLSGESRRPFEHGSGRLDLAQAIASRDNPLTARVFVNRIWQEHFGAGLVRTASDFGVRTERPSHPELLDYLAHRFVESGWSIKALHRLILTSDVYQQASHDRPECQKIDPSNRLLWKMNRRRLDWEATRDALLAVAGKLDLKMGGPAVDITSEPFSPRRTIYGLIDRQNLPGVFRAFDLASPDSHSPQRFITTAPQQALFMFNSPFVVEKSREFAARAAKPAPGAAPPSDAEQISRLYGWAFGRAPAEDELSLAKSFMAAHAAERSGNQLAPWEIYAQALLLTNEFYFID